MCKEVFVVMGTRPEAVKLAPLVAALRKLSPSLTPRVVVTGQHRQMLDQVLEFFRIRPDYDFDIMRPSQDLFRVTSAVLSAFRKLFLTTRPAALLVQGDTTTAFAAALAATYRQIPVGHVEAGLRSYNRLAPYPEELNRVLVSHMAHWHFAPTERNRQHLEAEGIRRHVYVVGNTVVDALLEGLKIVKHMGDTVMAARFSFLNSRRNLILVTGHRRESFGEGLENICRAIRQVAEARADVEFLYLVHLNPNVQRPVLSRLQGLGNVHLLDPVGYAEMVWLMDRSHIVLTDSGGIQEEAPSLGKPVLVMREVTERREGIEAGTAKLVGVDPTIIAREVIGLLEHPDHYRAMANAKNPYGDGHSAERIANILHQVV